MYSCANMRYVSVRSSFTKCNILGTLTRLISKIISLLISFVKYLSPITSWIATSHAQFIICLRVHWWLVAYEIGTGSLYVLCSLGWQKVSAALSIKRCCGLTTKAIKYKLKYLKVAIYFHSFWNDLLFLQVLWACKANPEMAWGNSLNFSTDLPQSTLRIIFLYTGIIIV